MSSNRKMTLLMTIRGRCLGNKLKGRYNQYVEVVI